MSDILPPLPALLAFMAAAAVLAVTPGPAVVYIVTRTLAQGRGAGLASVVGVAAGNLGNAAAASVGLAALLAASPAAFAVLKVLGAGYLCVLGMQALRSGQPAGPTEDTQATEPPPVSLRHLGWQGFVVALLNPKTAMFFAAFLPPFIQPTAEAAPQALALSTVFVAMAAVSDAAYVLLASALAPALLASGGAARLGRKASAAVYFALAVVALTGVHP